MLVLCVVVIIIYYPKTYMSYSFQIMVLGFSPNQRNATLLILTKQMQHCNFPKKMLAVQHSKLQKYGFMVIKNYTEFKKHHLIHQNCLKDPKTVDWINVVIYVSIRNGFAATLLLNFYIC